LDSFESIMKKYECSFVNTIIEQKMDRKSEEKNIKNQYYSPEIQRLLVTIWYVFLPRNLFADFSDI